MLKGSQTFSHCHSEFWLRETIKKQKFTTFTMLMSAQKLFLLQVALPGQDKVQKERQQSAI